jgi:DNA-binding Lrp family transcriptional regulator
VQTLDEALDFHPLCWTHPYRLGQIPFRVFFRLSGGGTKRAREFVSFVKSLTQASWFMSLIGLYQYCISLRADGYLELLALFAQIDQRFGDIIADKSVSTVAQLTCYTPFLAHSGTGPRKHLEYTATRERLELNTLDHKIIEILRDKPLASMQELGRAVSTSPNTVAYRFNRLLSSGAILGFGYSYDSAQYGESEFLVSLSTKGLGSSCYDKIAKFCVHHSNVLWLGRFIGHWDIELAVSAHQAQDLETFIQDLHTICRDQVGEVHIHTFSKLHSER